MFQFVKSFLFPVVKAQDEADLVDPQETIRAKCNSEGHAAHLLSRYQECNERVNAKSKTAETCAEELFDYIHALDHCVTKTLFSKLK